MKTMSSWEGDECMIYSFRCQEILQIYLHNAQCTPTHLSANKMNHVFAFPAEVGPHVTNSEGMEGWVDLFSSPGWFTCSQTVNLLITNRSDVESTTLPTTPRHQHRQSMNRLNAFVRRSSTFSDVQSALPQSASRQRTCRSGQAPCNSPVQLEVLSAAATAMTRSCCGETRVQAPSQSSRLAVAVLRDARCSVNGNSVAAGKCEVSQVRTLLLKLCGWVRKGLTPH